MAKTSPQEPAAIQARLTRLLQRRRELDILLNALERYLKFLDQEPHESAFRIPRKAVGGRHKAA